MSFFRNLRSSVTRKHNSSDKSCQSRNSGLNRSSSARYGKTSSLFINREEIENECEDEPTGDGLVRSETFTINEHESIFVRNQEATRTSMFGRFSTFTKKKKISSSKSSGKGKDEELKATTTKNENLSSSYKRYPTPSDVVSTKSDPFHCLYERGNQQSGVIKREHGKDMFKKIDYGTYRKNRLSGHIQEQLEEERNPSEVSKVQHSESSHKKEKSQEKEEKEDKYKTVTINSFRKSFRERFLKQQRDVPHNPSWFVEVDAPSGQAKDEKSRRQDLLVFENEQYRPTARSPIRLEYRSPTKSPTQKSSRTSDTHRSQSPQRPLEGRHEQSIRRSTEQSRSRSPSTYLHRHRQVEQYSSQKPLSSERLSVQYPDESSKRLSIQSQGRSSGTRSPSRHTDKSPNRRSQSPDVQNIQYLHRSSEHSTRQSRGKSPNQQLHYIRSSEERSQSRTSMPVKRNETFRIDRESNEPSIRIEIKNSITPNEPGRIVPVGVAKPIQSPILTDGEKIYPKDWTEPGRDSSKGHNLYQTCIQISSHSSNMPSNRFLRESNSNQTVANPKSTKKVNSSSNSYISNYSPLKSYELLTNIKHQKNVPASYTMEDSYLKDPSHGSVHQISKTTVIPSPQSYDSKRWIKTPTISSQQKISIHSTDKLVRKDTTNNRNTAANLSRRVPIKAPWR